MRIHGPRQQGTPDVRQREVQATRDVGTTKATGAVDTFDANQKVTPGAEAGKEQGFFGKIFSAIGKFFASLWSFITGTGWKAPADEAAPASEQPQQAVSPTSREAISPASSLRRVATSATSPSPRVGSTRGTARVASGATFGGVPIRDVGQWYTNATGTAFGGSLDPDDNGIGAFGDKTGPGGREGVAIPQRVMAELTGTNDKSVHQQYKVEVTNRATGKTAVFDIVDRGPSESIWRREGKAVVDLTEGAVEELGGSVRKNRRGHMVGTTGVDDLSFRIVKR